MRYFKNFQNCIVALSGGIDSAAVLKLAVEKLGAENVAAATCINTNIFRYEVENAKIIASELGVKWFNFITTTPVELYNNSEDKCYYCKKNVIKGIHNIALRYGYEVICDGSNVDDLNDYRPGMKALKELNGFSPLLKAGLGKEDARQIASDIKNNDLYFTIESCAATRIKTGKITEERLKKIEKIEDKLRYTYPGIRVRDYSNKAKIEFKEKLKIDEKDKSEIYNVVKDYFQKIEF